MLPFPQGYRDLRMNDSGVLGVVTGVGTARAAATIMALGLDPRFDLSKAYWVVAGIAGIDTEEASLGSAAWAEWIVDGDLGHEIDARRSRPAGRPGWCRCASRFRTSSRRRLATPRRCSGSTRAWSSGPTSSPRTCGFIESEQMKAERALYPGEVARRPPFVLKGDTMSAGTFWIGAKLTEWANDWVASRTQGQGRYVTSAMEDTGTLQSLTWLSRAGRVDVRRVLVLRAGSDHDLPPPGRTAADQLARTKIGQYAAFLPALDSAYRVGSVVVDRLLADWATHRDTPPSAQQVTPARK